MLFKTLQSELQIIFELDSVDKKNLKTTVKLVITNSSGPAIFVRHNRVNLCSKQPICPENPFVITECSLTTEFLITKYNCSF